MGGRGHNWLKRQRSTRLAKAGEEPDAPEVRQSTETPEAEASHDLAIGGRSVWHSFSFDLGRDLDIVRLADRLLKADVATVAASPSRKGLRVSHDTKDMSRYYARYDRVRQVFEILHSDAPSIGRMFRIHPLLTIQIVHWTRHAIYSYAMLRIRNFFGVSRAHSSEIQITETDGQKDQSIERGSMDTMRSAVAQIAEVIDNQHIEGAHRLRTEQQIYLSRYFLQTEPFIRLRMDRSFFDDGDVQDIAIEVSLMIHRSGICILTMATQVPTNLDATSIKMVSQASLRTLDSVRVSDPILKRFGNRVSRLSLTYEAIMEMSEGRLWWRGTSDVTISMRSVFYHYLDAIEKIARREIKTEWRCYTTTFLGPPVCGCDGSEAKQVHGDEFAQIMTRSLAPVTVNEKWKDDFLENQMSTREEELWVTAGAALHIHWEEVSFSFANDLEKIIPIESAVLQMRQLEAIDFHTSKPEFKDKDIASAQRDLAIQLPEYGRNLVATLDGPPIVSALLSKMGGPQLYGRLNDRVKVLESIVNTHFTRKQSRRSLAISAVGLMIVVLLLLPRIRELLTLLLTQNPSTHDFVLHLYDIFGGPTRTLFFLYAIAVALVVAIFLAIAGQLRLPTLRRRKSNFGYPTDRDVMVTRVAAPPLPGGVEDASSDSSATEDDTPDPFPER